MYSCSLTVWFTRKSNVMSSRRYRDYCWHLNVVACLITSTSVALVRVVPNQAQRSLDVCVKDRVRLSILCQSYGIPILLEWLQLSKTKCTLPKCDCPYLKRLFFRMINCRLLSSFSQFSVSDSESVWHFLDRRRGSCPCPWLGLGPSLGKFDFAWPGPWLVTLSLASALLWSRRLFKQRIAGMGDNQKKVPKYSKFFNTHCHWHCPGNATELLRFH